MRRIIRSEVILFFESDLPNMASHCEQKECGFSIYKGILIQWDEDTDIRILDFIDDMEEWLRIELLIIQEHEAGLYLRWKDDNYIPPEYEEGKSIDVRDGDVWSIMESTGI